MKEFINDATVALARDALERIRQCARAVSPVAPNPRGKVMTLSRVHRAIDKGYGQGRDEHYQPWIRVRRRLCSPVSNLFVLHVPTYCTRSLHLLSGLERRAAQLAIWLGALEIREQFPLWPEPHPHPILGRDGGQPSPQMVAGLLDIAEQAGIRHGVFPGTKVPYIATTDLMLEVTAKSGGTRLVSWPCKPMGVRSGPRGKRIEERLMLERLYAQSINAFFYDFSDETISDLLAEQLDWFMPRQLSVATFVGTAVFEDFTAVFLRHAQQRTIRECVEAAGLSVGIIDRETQYTVFRLACWLGNIPIDFSRHIRMKRRMDFDTGFKDSLRNQLFGDLQ